MSNQPITSGPFLADITEQRLHQFRGRRLRLKSFSGAGWTLLLAASAILIAVLIDAFVMQSWGRWLASTILYMVAAASVLRLVVWPWLSKPSFPNEARLMEQHEPNLKDRLLSAVELSEDTEIQTTEKPERDSLAFRGQLQEQVADRIRGVKIASLLPWSTIRRALIMGICATAILGLLCMIPQLHLPQRIARALLPFANLGRVSSVAIELERPNPGTQLVALNDVVAVGARVIGPRPKEVWLETQASGELTRTPMLIVAEADGSDADNSLFECTLVADQPELDYRVVAAGAATPWYRLSARARPRVLEFEKTLTPPSYSGQPTVVQVAPHGNVVAYQDSQVELALTISEAAKSVEIRWQSDGSDERTVPLEWNASRQKWITSVAMTNTRTYHVDVVSEESGFRNDYSPLYELETRVDQPPVVRWIRPRNTTSMVGVSELVPMSVQTFDEFELASLGQVFRVNDSDWRTVSRLDALEPIEGTPETNDGELSEFMGNYSWEVDLLPLQVTPGDLLEIKMVAKDRKGQVVESELRRIMISSVSMSLEASPSELARREIAESLEQLAAKATELVDPKAEEVDRATAETLMQQLESEIPEAIAQILEASRTVDQRSDAAELAGLGSQLSQMLTESLPKIASQEIESEKDQERQNNELKRLVRDLQEIGSHARSFSSFDITARLSQQLSVLSEAAKSLSEQETTSNEQSKRQLAVLTQEMRALERMVASDIKHLHTRNRDRFRSFAEQFGNLTSSLEEKVRNDRNGSQARQNAANFVNQLRDYSMFSRIDGNIYEMSKNAHRWLRQKTKPISDRIAEAARFAGQATELDAELKEALEMERSLAKASSFGDRELASDLGRIRRAAQAAPEHSDPSQILNAIAKDARVLTAAGELRIALAQLRELTQKERWDIDSPLARSEHPRLHDILTNQQEKAVDQARRLDLPRELREQLDQVRWNQELNRANDVIQRRFWDARTPVSAASELKQQTERVANILQALEPMIAEARQNLSEYSPSLQELAQEAAEATQQVSQQTAELGERIEREEVPDPEASVAQLEQAVEELQEPIQELREALVDEADAMQLLDQNELPALRRADAAIDIVDQAQEQTAESLDQVGEQAQPEALAEAAEQQADASEALNQLAELLDPAASQESQQAMENLRNSQTGEPSQDNPLYQTAEQLARLAAASPQEVLQALEEQLPSSPEMQSELSEIAEQATRQALEQLEQAAERQGQLQPRLENSDPRVQAQKELLANDIQAARNAATQMSSLQLAESSRAAEIGKQSESSQQVREAMRNLSEALGQVRTPSANQPMEELQAQAQQVYDALEQVQEELNGTRQNLAEVADEPVFDSGAELNNRRRELKDRARRVQQNNVRNLQQAVRVQQQNERRAESQLRNQERDVQRAEQQLQRLRNDREKTDNESRQQQLDRQIASEEQKLEREQEERVAQQEILEGTKQRRKAEEQRLAEANQRNTPHLANDNPGAELAAEMAEQAAAISQDLAEQLEPWSGSQAPAEASGNQVASEQYQQDSIRDTVDNAAETVERAARHEERLGQDANQEQLNAAAEQIADASDQELAQSQEDLAAAMESAGDKNGRASPETSAAAGEASLAGEEAIREAAESLAQAMGQSSQNSPPAESQPGQPSSLLPPQEMAQLLDELDQQLNSSAANTPGQPNGQANSSNPGQPGQGQPGQPNLGPQDNNSQNSMLGQNMPSTLAEAARQLAAQLSQNRQPQSSQPQANQDIGMATEANLANADPQPPVAVQVVDVERFGEDWGQLRDRRAEGLNETRKYNVAPQFREQVDAYYRSLSKQRR